MLASGPEPLPETSISPPQGERLPSLPIVFALAKGLGVEAMDLMAVDARKPRTKLIDAVRRGDREQVRATLERLGLA